MIHNDKYSKIRHLVIIIFNRSIFLNFLYEIFLHTIIIILTYFIEELNSKYQKNIFENVFFQQKILIIRALVPKNIKNCLLMRCRSHVKKRWYKNFFCE